MLRHLKCFSLLGTLLVGAQAALAFSLIGPANEDWQVAEIGYDPLTAPKNIGEEYRRNTPVMYYTVDAIFLDFFGTNGLNAIEEAFAVFNALTNVSSYSQGLTEFPLQVTRENYQASALGLTDLKSIAMKMIIEQLGLAEPERFVWTLHSRWNDGSAPCPDGMHYLVIRRNWDIVPTPLNQLQASSYVNGTLYTYFVLEVCNPPNPLADAIEVSVDPLDFTYTAVASGSGPLAISPNIQLPVPGRYYTGLTRDDVAGMRYLIRANNFNWEDPGSGTFSYVTNTVPQLLYTSNLTEFAAQALTNSPAALQTLYPGLVVTSSSNFFATVWVTNTFAYITNSPFDVAGTTRIAFATNRFLTIESRFEHTFDNIRAVVFTNNQWTTIPIVTLRDFTNVAFNTRFTLSSILSQSPFAPVGTFSLTTNVTTRTFATNTVVGEFIILPTNACEVVILGPQLTFTNAYVNILSIFTNEVAISNAVIVTNVTELVIDQIIDYSTNHAFLTLPVSCVQSNLVIAGGVERLRFERRDFDSLIGRFFEPFTNHYSLPTITNSTLTQMRVQRPVIQPDFLITAEDADLTPGPAEDPTLFFDIGTTWTFNTNALGFYPQSAGPGTIEGPTLFSFNKVGPAFWNYSRQAYFLETAETNQVLLLAWGSFDGTTNPPVVYPNGTSVRALEEFLFLHVTPATLPEGAVGQPYQTVNFTLSGGHAPFTWTLAPGSPGLPPGLTLSPSGTLSGVPTQRATFDFIIRVTDVNGRHVDRHYSIKINW